MDSSQVNVNKNHAVMLACGVFLSCLMAGYPAAAAKKHSSPAKVVEKAEKNLQVEDVQKMVSPALIVRFSNSEVNFMDSLKKLVDAVSVKKPDASYYVQSVIPESAGTVGDSYRNYNKNLRALVGGLNELGVPMEKIKIDITNSSTISDHEMRIFVR